MNSLSIVISTANAVPARIFILSGLAKREEIKII